MEESPFSAALNRSFSLISTDLVEGLISMFEAKITDKRSSKGKKKVQEQEGSKGRTNKVSVFLY